MNLKTISATRNLKTMFRQGDHCSVANYCEEQLQSTRPLYSHVWVLLFVFNEMLISGRVFWSLARIATIVIYLVL